MKNVKKIIVLLLMTIMFVVHSMNLGLNYDTDVVQAATVSISKSSMSLIVGNTYTLRLNGTTKTGKWSSANKKIATVDSKGKVTALKAGKTEIYVQFNNKKYSCKLTVKDPVLNYKSIKLDVDDIIDLRLKGVKGKIKWSSENPKIASVDSTGEFIANAPGKVNIKASVGSSTYVCKVTVNKIEVYDLNIREHGYYLYPGENVKIEVDIYPADATIKTVTYKSNNENIAKVNKDGVITAVNVGTVDIYATSVNGKTDYLTIEIVQQPILSVRDTRIQLRESKEEILNKLGQPSYIAKSNYGDETYVYSDDYNKLLFVYMKEDMAVGFYTNAMDYEFNGINKQSTGPQDDIWNNRYKCTFYVDETGDNSVNGVFLGDYSIILNKNTDEILTNMEKEVLHVTNSYRVQAGLLQLAWSEAANVSAKKHSQDMVNNDYFSHNSLSGVSPFDRMKTEGISYSYAGENIAAGQRTSFDVGHSWYQSEGHRRNMLNVNYTYLGVGIATGGDSYGIYHTQNFYSQR